jgi:DeoR/GlpR family transcriptional regulator of sugar metabolism
MGVIMMTIINRRQEDILKELDQKDVNVVDLCETHNVSTVTIRKDLNFLENEKLYASCAWRIASSLFMLLKEM